MGLFIIGILCCRSVISFVGINEQYYQFEFPILVLSIAENMQIFTIFYN